MLENTPPEYFRLFAPKTPPKNPLSALTGRPPSGSFTQNQPPFFFPLIFFFFSWFPGMQKKQGKRRYRNGIPVPEKNKKKKASFFTSLYTHPTHLTRGHFTQLPYPIPKAFLSVRRGGQVVFWGETRPPQLVIDLQVVWWFPAGGTP